jgi:hypothetical protein
LVLFFPVGGKEEKLHKVYFCELSMFLLIGRYGERGVSGKEDIAKLFYEADKALMVHGGANKAGRFLEVAVFAKGGHKGGLWLPEGRDGKGWQRFARELRVLLAPVGGPEVSRFRS